MQAGSSAEGLAMEDDAHYRTDSFRMECMKVLPCSKRFVHDWTECPFAHPQEKARRRDPRVHNYTGIACPSMKKASSEGCCAFGDHCPYAHNVFEYWLHPTRYRTQLCNDGSNCKRKICFFAHSLDELRVPACKPFVSPEALAAAAAAAAADAEAKRKAATVGSPLSAFAAVSPGPSPQRSSLDALRAAQQQQQQQQASDARLSASSVPAPISPSTNDDATMGSSPADAAVHQALQQLMGAGFSSKDQQVIELVTSLLAQDRVSPEQAASILQQMLPPDALNTLQARLNTPRGSMEDVRCYSDPLGYRSEAAQQAQHTQQARASSFESVTGGDAYGDRAAGSARNAAAALLGQAQAGAAQAPPQHVMTLEQMAAMQAAQTMGFANAYPGGIVQWQGGPTAGMLGLDPNPRLSLESARSSFDTGAHQLLASCRSSSGSDDSVGPSSSTSPAAPRQADVTAALAASQKQMAAAAQQAQQRPSMEAALRRMSEEQVVAGAAAAAEHQQQYQRAAVQAAAAQQAARHHEALQAVLQQQRRQQLLQQQQQQQAAQQGARPSDDSSRMSFERGSMDLGTPRGSMDASYPPNLFSSGSLPSQLEVPPQEGGPSTPEASVYRTGSAGWQRAYYSGQLTSVPEQFPMINAPPPTGGWGGAAAAGRYSLDSGAAADRLSQDLSRMSFEAAASPSAAARLAPQTANPFASSFFTPGTTAAERLSAPVLGDRRGLALPPLPGLRTSGACNCLLTRGSPFAALAAGPEEHEAAAAAQQQQQQLLLGGTALHRLQ
ncbi:hypothetical protein CHLNCDRAFT_134430 [Chlorella variabilis]|uniref:C3H1-type domain-containing protein n=1 Tax=Chlorella variabilis TaxID=554065 RepID=E1ZFZ3_CHLVA|nr:hypothetical protein CHLNCDRAFT_134430 [Chlorella variabilis]EFN55206.1 hypothetical protein CHLNCDRAFT_134430 [Chlorella variabilis]|eukprot:XP_005847308.1 hypothetical protein CHLNCDRAFT_134430 [Chlorella variabilis]